MELFVNTEKEKQTRNNIGLLGKGSYLRHPPVLTSRDVYFHKRDQFRTIPLEQKTKLQGADYPRQNGSQVDIRTEFLLAPSRSTGKREVIPVESVEHDKTSLRSSSSIICGKDNVNSIKHVAQVMSFGEVKTYPNSIYRQELLAPKDWKVMKNSILSTSPIRIPDYSHSRVYNTHDVSMYSKRNRRLSEKSEDGFQELHIDPISLRQHKKFHGRGLFAGSGVGLKRGGL